MSIIDRIRGRESAAAEPPAEARITLTTREAEDYRAVAGAVRSLESAGITPAMLQLLPDMLGFDLLGTSPRNRRTDLPDRTREELVSTSRTYYLREPIYWRAITLWTDMTFGRAWQVEAPESTLGQRLIDDVWNARHNRAVFSRKGLRKSSAKLLVDGERVFAFFTDAAGKGGRISVRTFDPLEIAEVLTNPEDRDEIWYYRRTYTLNDGAQSKTYTKFYRHWDFTDDRGKPRNDPHPRMTANAADRSGWGIATTVPEPGVWLAIVAVNDLGQRGYPMMTAAQEWIREHRLWMTDRIAINRARSLFAMKATVKGDQAAVNTLQSAFSTPSALDPTTGYRPAVASTFVQNEAVNLDPMETVSDGASAQHDQRALRTMALAGTGLPEHLMGDASAANLATAKAIERPMELGFGSYQEDWVDFYLDCFHHFARWWNSTEDTGIDIDPPNVLARDLAAVSNAIAQLVTAIPPLGDSPDVVRMVLTDLGIEDVDAAMELLEPMLAAATAAALRGYDLAGTPQDPARQPPPFGSEPGAEPEEEGDE